MKLNGGIKLLAEHEGSGTPAKKGDQVLYNLRLFLNKGDEIPFSARQAEYLPEHQTRTEGGYRFVDHSVVLGSRHAIAGVEYALLGMKPGGYRKLRVSPHLAYDEQGLEGLIPPNAVLIVELWLRQLTGK